MKFLKFILISLLIFSFSALGQDDIEGIRKRAEALSHEFKFSEAIAEIGKAIALQSYNAKLYLRRAHYHSLARNSNELTADVNKAVSIDPLDKKIMSEGISVLRMGKNIDEAERLCKALFALGNPDASAWNSLILIKIDRNDYAGALDDTSRALELFPDNSLLKKKQAYILQLMGDSEKAIEIYGSLILSEEAKLEQERADHKRGLIRITLTDLYFRRAQLHFKKQQKEAAISGLKKAIELEPIEANYHRRSVIYRINNMNTEALADLNTAISLDTNKHFLFLVMDRGILHFQMKNYSEALKDFEEAARIDEGQKESADKWIEMTRKKMSEAPGK